MSSSIVTKLLKLLTTISASQKPLSFSEIVKKSELNKSTIHRLLAIAMEERLVRLDPDRKVYVLGPTVFDLVRNAFQGYDIQSIALDEMIRLSELFDANVTIGIPSGLEVVYLRILETPRSMGGFQRPGMREDIHCSASGKALLAFLPDKVIASRLDGYHYKRFTERTVTTAEGFRDELDFVRQNGFAKNDREEYDHFLGIASPLFNYMGEPIAVLNVWSVYQRHSMKELLGWTDELKASADRINALIGGVAPDVGTLIDN